MHGLNAWPTDPARIAPAATPARTRSADEGDFAACGGLLFSCLGRSGQWYEQNGMAANFEANAFAAAFPGRPLAGFLANGEIFGQKINATPHQSAAAAAGGGGGEAGSASASTGACTINRPCAQQYVGKSQSCMVMQEMGSRTFLPAQQ